MHLIWVANLRTISRQRIKYFVVKISKMFLIKENQVFKGPETLYIIGFRRTCNLNRKINLKVHSKKQNTKETRHNQSKEGEQHYPHQKPTSCKTSSPNPIRKDQEFVLPLWDRRVISKEDWDNLDFLLLTVIHPSSTLAAAFCQEDGSRIEDLPSSGGTEPTSREAGTTKDPIAIWNVGGSSIEEEDPTFFKWSVGIPLQESTHSWGKATP